MSAAPMQLQLPCLQSGGHQVYTTSGVNQQPVGLQEAAPVLRG